MSAVPVVTPAVPAVTMQDLELEHAELLPVRETLLCCRFYPTHVGDPSPMGCGPRMM
jgi:hypothetical protein